jgi:hypothetical protein
MADGPTWGHPESGKVSTETEQETWGGVSVALWLSVVQARAILTIEREKIRAAIRLAKMCLVFAVLVMYLVSHVEPIMSRDLYLDSKEGGCVGCTEIPPLRILGLPLSVLAVRLLLACSLCPW